MNKMPRNETIRKLLTENVESNNTSKNQISLYPEPKLIQQNCKLVDFTNEMLTRKRSKKNNIVSVLTQNQIKAIIKNN